MRDARIAVATAAASVNRSRDALECSAAPVLASAALVASLVDHDLADHPRTPRNAGARPDDAANAAPLCRGHSRWATWCGATLAAHLLPVRRQPEVLQ